VRGSHIVVARLYEGKHAYILQNSDRRIIFAVPFHERFTLIGTTDVPQDAPLNRVMITPEETIYLCAIANRYFKKQIGREDVLWSYSGVRSLRDDGAAEAFQVTRDYDLVLERAAGGSPMLSVVGGKITTYRRLAETALELLQPYLGRQAARGTANTPLPGGDLPDGSLLRFCAEAQRRWPFVAPEHLQRLACAYGTRMERMLRGAHAVADLGEQMGADLTGAEVDYLNAEEWALTAEDILWRRTKLGLLLTAAEMQSLERYLERGKPGSRRSSRV